MLNYEEMQEKRKEKYAEKKANKLERYEELQEKHIQIAEEKSNSINISTVRGMMGEPVKIGHHSEKRHRKLLERADNDMKSSFEHFETANYYESKIKSVNSNTTINSDDPEALQKLKDKLEKAQAEHQGYKDYNKKAKKEGKETFRSYVLQNSNGRMKGIKTRIEILEKQEQKVKDFAESGEIKKQNFDSGEVVHNIIENRLQILFDEKPNEEIRAKLKRYGFRWSRNNMAWQRQLTNNAIRSLNSLKLEGLSK